MQSAGPEHVLDSMFIHPLKSGEPHRVDTLKVLMDGIELDRRLMVVGETRDSYCQGATAPVWNPMPAGWRAPMFSPRWHEAS